MKITKKMPLWYRIFGKKYFIKEVEWLEEDEILRFFYRVYVGRKK